MNELYSTMMEGMTATTSDADTETRAAVYARTSSASQQFGYSIDEQVRQCVDRCRMLDWDVIFVFRDEAKSGKDADRPMFQEMLKQAEHGRFDVLVFWKLHRFSRSIMHAVQLENQFRDWDVALHSVTEQIDTTTPPGRFNFRNIANAAEFERELIKQRTTMGHIARAMDHKWPNGSPPLGYELDDEDRLHVHPREAALVRRIFKMYLEQKSMPGVADDLNQSGVSTKQGRTWTPNDVKSILDNSVYRGDYLVGDVEAEVDEYRIVSRELFQEATAVRYRFQSSRAATRGSMPVDRKRQRVNRITEAYSEYCRNPG